MRLKTMPKAKILEVVDKLYNAGRYSIVVILTDGQALCGDIPRGVYRIDSEYNSELVLASERCFSHPGTLEFYHGEIHNEHSIYVPLEKIAGIAPLSYLQEQIKSNTLRSGDTYYIGSAYKSIFEDSLKKALERGFEVKRHFCVYKLYIHKPHFDWGNIKFTDNTPLYCDWDYFIKKNGELNSLGVGFGVSFSAGWSKSLWSSFQSKIAKTEVSLEEVCNRSEVTLLGYVSFLVHRSNEHSLSEEETLSMEGTDWIGAVITRNKIMSIEQLKGTIWAICYFRKDSFMFPQNLWEKFAEPIKIFGEVVPAPFITEFGKANCFVKARAAAYIKRIGQRHITWYKWLRSASPKFSPSAKTLFTPRTLAEIVGWGEKI